MKTTKTGARKMDLPLEMQLKPMDISVEERRRIANENIIQNAATFGNIKAAYVPITELYIPSETYQRNLHTTAKKIADSFDDEKCGFLSVRYNSDSMMFEVIDGQHRFVAAKLAGKTSLPCHIMMSANSIEKAAMYFSQQDDNKIRLTLRDKFKAALISKDTTCMKLNQICKDFLLEIVPTKDSCCVRIQGVRELLRIYTLSGEDGVRRCFNVIKNSKWHEQKGAYGEYILASIGQMLMDTLDKTEVMEKLVKVFRKTTPEAIISRAKFTYPEKTTRTAVLTYVADLVNA